MPTGTPLNVVIVVLNRSGSPISKYLLRNARPVKWVMKPPQPAGGNDVVTESLTIAHEGFKRIK